MPVLAGYFGSSSSYFCYFHKFKKPIYFSTPLIPVFNSKTLKNVLKDHNIKLGDTRVIYTRSTDYPKVDLPHSKEIALQSLLSQQAKYQVFHAAYEPNKQSDFSANMAEYRFVTPSDPSDQFSLDYLISAESAFHPYREPKHLLFTGDRFFDIYSDLNLKQVLIHDLIKTFGIYEIYLDKDAKYILSSLLNHDYQPERVGTFVKCPDKAEITFNTPDGETQVIKLSHHSINGFTLSGARPALLTIKTKGMETHQVPVFGGTFGVIISSLSPIKNVYLEPQSLNKSIKCVQYFTGFN